MECRGIKANGKSSDLTNEGMLSIQKHIKPVGEGVLAVKNCQGNHATRCRQAKRIKIHTSKHRSLVLSPGGECRSLGDKT